MPVAAVPLVIDTQTVLDLLLFDDPACAGLRPALESGHCVWLACPGMRTELQRVLTYPTLARQCERRALGPERLLAAMDALAHWLPEPEPSACRCRDPDDQVFIDLAVARRARLLSRDRDVLALRRTLAARGVEVIPSWINAAQLRCDLAFHI